MNLALCKCGIDMTEHVGMDPYDDPEELQVGEHHFDASGTKHRCEKIVETDVFGGRMIFLCPRPRYHLDMGVPCGPLTGEKLW